MTLRRLGLATLMSLLLVPLLWAQGTRTIGGRTYTVHTVEAGQTLFAISRAHAVPVDALLAANPEARDGLAIGQELLVPQDAVVKKEARTAPELVADGELLHTVAKKETLFGISRRYGVDINALLDRNPELSGGLREGMVVRVPVSAVEGQLDVAMRPAMPLTTFDHVVQPGETLYALSKRFGVSPEEISAANGGSPEGLKAGDIIRIPLAPGMEPPPPQAAEVVPIGKLYRVGFMLPFATVRNDSIRANALQAPAYHEASRIAAQFYGGALLALDTLEKMGLRAEVRVVDMGDDAHTWTSVLKEPGLREMDIFIGPFHRSAIEQLARVNTRAHIVCPVPQSSKVILGYPTVSKVTPTNTDLIRHTARYVASRHARDNVVLLKPEIYADKGAQDLMARVLQEALLDRSGRLRDSVLVARPGRRDLGDLPGKLSNEKVNVLVAPSDDVEYVTALVAKLKPLAAKQKIVVVGLESWLAMETVSATDLEPLGFLFASGTFTNVRDARTQAFTKAFRERFGNDVDEYAFLGYDVTLYYLEALMTLGPGFPARFEQVNAAPLHMGFRMTRTGPENGYRNEYAIMLQQLNMQLVKAP